MKAPSLVQVVFSVLLLTNSLIGVNAAPRMLYTRPVSVTLTPVLPEVTQAAQEWLVSLELFADVIGGTCTHEADGHVTVTYAGVVYTCLPPTESKKPDWNAPMRFGGGVYAPLSAIVGTLGGTATLDTTRLVATVTLPGMTAPLALPMKHVNPSDFQDHPPSQLFTANLDGSGLCQLSYEIHGSWYPSFFPDGNHYVFTHDASIYLGALNTLRARCLLKRDDAAGITYSKASVSHDGNWVLFEQEQMKIKGYTGSSPYYESKFTFGIIHPDGTEMQLLAEGSGAVFSPDSNHIAFQSGKPGVLIDEHYTELYLVDCAKRNLRRIAVIEHGPVFSPDGSKILFLRRNGMGRKAMTYLVTGKGAGIVYDSYAKGSVELGGFAPDNMRFVFRDVDHGGISVINYNGTGYHLFPITPALAPLFTPDGEQILFWDWNDNLYIVASDGSNQRPFMPEMLFDFGQTFSFSPDGKSMLFTGQRKEQKPVQ